MQKQSKDAYLKSWRAFVSSAWSNPIAEACLTASFRTYGSHRILPTNEKSTTASKNYSNSVQLRKVAHIAVNLDGAKKVTAEFSSIINEIAQHKLDPKQQRMSLLKGLLKRVPAGGLCSVLLLNKFFSEGGKKIADQHLPEKPKRYKYLLWIKHIRDGNSEIERRIYKRVNNRKVGVESLWTLFSAEEWERCPLYQIAKKFSVADIAYLWIRCSENELWVICLRRTDSETPFSNQDLRKLESFGELFLALKDIWFAENLSYLSPRVQEAIRLTATGRSAKQVAKLMNVSRRTVESHLEIARKSYGITGSTHQLIAKLLRTEQS